MNKIKSPKGLADLEITRPYASVFSLRPKVEKKSSELMKYVAFPSLPSTDA